MGKRHWFFLISGLVILVGVISLSAFGLRPGIEFSSGSIMTLSFEQTVGREEMATLGHSEAIIQRTGGADFVIRTTELKPEVRDPVTGEVITPAERDTIEQALRERFGQLTVLDFYSISPIVSAEIGRNSAIAVSVAAVAILLYIAWAFHRLRRPMRPFNFGAAAVLALVHDVLVVLGIFSLLGWITGIEIDAMFITGVLTVIGYSVHDTIVVFDRIRENSTRYPGADLETTINISINETLGRSLNTSLTVLFVILALFLFGGMTIHNFVLVLLIGVIAGTYSSVCIASQLLVVWHNREVPRLLRRLRPRRVLVGGG